MVKIANDFMYRFDVAYGPKLGVRAATFRSVLREAVSLQARNVVETGCIRKEDNWAGDGQSTIILNDYAKWHGGNFRSVDMDTNACELARRFAPEALVTSGDSVEFLNLHKSPIDLLYLDSFDLDNSDPHPAALHCLFEFCAAMKNLHTGSIVFIDDSQIGNDFVIGGKGKYVAQYFKHLGVEPFTFGYQAAWLMP